MTIAAPASSITALKLVEGDLKAVGRIAEITYADAETPSVLDIDRTRGGLNAARHPLDRRRRAAGLCAGGAGAQIAAVEAATPGDALGQPRAALDPHLARGPADRELDTGVISRSMPMAKRSSATTTKTGSRSECSIGAAASAQ